jgi:prenyl protein peptidase
MEPGSCAGSSHRKANGWAPDRNDPQVVRERFVRVGIASAIAPFIALLAAALPGGPRDCPDVPLLTWFGVWGPGFGLAALLPLALTMVLFLGPLVMSWLERDPTTSLFAKLHENWLDIVSSPVERDLALRQLVIGPLSEEWVFRACMCPLIESAGFSEGANVFLSAVIFGLAHVHHIFDDDVSYVTVAFQFSYTAAFGSYSAYLFLRTGQVAGPFLAHSFCNWQGFPAFHRIRGHPHQRTLAVAFVLGLGSFVALVTVDAFCRPALFSSAFWAEEATCFHSSHR